MSKDPPLAEAAEKLADAYSSLIKRVEDPRNHGLFRGSMEESIAAAQSAAMLKPSGVPFNHAENVDNSRINLTEIKSDLFEALADVNKADPIAFFRIDKVLKPSISYRLAIKDVQSETLSLIKEIKPLHAARLEGLGLDTGERTYWSLPSTQITQRRHLPFFQDRKIQPSLYPLSCSTLTFAERIKKIPINSAEIRGQLAPMKQALDIEIHASPEQFGRGVQAFSIIYGQLKKKL